MLQFPSYPSAILCGAIGIPLFMWGIQYIELKNISQSYLIMWSFFGFLVPMFFSTIDVGYFIKIYKRDASLFRSCITTKDYDRFLIPSAKRILIYLLSGVTSVLGVKMLNIAI
jgi:hypothetical protein